MNSKTDHNDNQICKRHSSQIQRLADKPTSRISASLASHLQTCPECRERVDRITEVQCLLDQLKWRSMPAGTLELCNRQALKKLQRRVRESDHAVKLAEAKPDVPKWQQTTIQLARGGIGIAAGLAVMATSLAADSGLHLAHDRLKDLAQIHQRQHIGNLDNPDDILG